jgi:TorA maturation chaperone TorD
MTADNKLAFYQKLTASLSDVYLLIPSDQIISALEALQPEASELGLAEGALLGSLASARGNDSLKDIAVDYTGLFCSTDITAPFPYESVHTGEQRLMMQESAGMVTRLYAEDGFECKSESNEPPDHLGCELGYIAFLIGNAVEAEANGDASGAQGLLAKARGFVAEHIQNWVPPFCNEVAGRAETAYFRQIAALTESTVVSLAERLGS